MKILISNICLSLILNIIIFCQNSDWKAGRIIPIPPIEIKDPIKLIYEDSKIIINNNIASITKKQTFKNVTHKQLEGSYIFPLQNDAFITEFSLFINNEPVKAEILDSKQAKQIYEDIVRKLKDPSILEEFRSNLYRVKIFPFAPFSEKIIEMKYLQQIKPSGNTYRFIYSLSHNLLSKDFKNNIVIELNSTNTISNIYSPSHEIIFEKVNDNKYIVKIDFKKSSLVSDFILYYTISSQKIDAMNLIYDDEKEDPYFMLSLFSNNEQVKSNVKKNIIFTLDISGSMTGVKIDQAKGALKYCLKNLKKGDYYSIFTFNNEVNEIISNKEFNYDDSDQKIIEKIENILPDGGTNLNNAIITSLKNAKKNLPNYLILLTDGLPTVGVRNPDEILKNVAKFILGNIRIFTFGVGNDLDVFLLDRLASEFRGENNYVREGEDIELEISSFFRKISNPVLTDCKIEFDNQQIYDIYPNKLPDLFQNSTISIFGRLKNISNGEIIITGYIDKEKKRFSYKIEQSFISKKNDFIPLLWAKRKIAFLLDEIRNNGEDKELINEITKLSKKYGIITPYTSYLITDDDTKSNIFSDAVIEKKQLFDSKSGYQPLSLSQKQTIIDQSQKIERMKNSSKVEYYSYIKNINGKTFIFKNDFWVDIDFDNSSCNKIIEIEFASDDYFSLINNDDELRKYLCVSNKIKLFYKSKCYIIK